MSGCNSRSASPVPIGKCAFARCRAATIILETVIVGRQSANLSTRAASPHESGGSFACPHRSPLFPVSSPERRRSRSEEHTSELQSLMRISYAVFCLKKKKRKIAPNHILHITYTHCTTSTK